METQAEHGRNEPEFSVSQLSSALKRMVEDVFGAVRLRGEISGYRGLHSSGHAYFALKDDKARIEAVIWRGAFAKLRLKPEEGMEVIVTGKLTTYPGSSKYQIVIETLEPAGAGALMALIEERRTRLEKEGLFDTKRKKQLPFMPLVIGVITSPTGAVIRDILHRIRERFPLHIIVWPVRVQGETTAAEAIEALRGFNQLERFRKSGNRFSDKNCGKTQELEQFVDCPSETKNALDDYIPRPDVIILARGGGSLEDLWGFNDEELVRTIAASSIPVISAIGHETDWTLADFAADLRAPTPTAAAEMAVPVRAELQAKLAAQEARLHVAMNRFEAQQRTHLATISRALPSLDHLLALPRRHFDEVSRRADLALTQAVQRKKLTFDSLSKRLSILTLTRQLQRGHERFTQREKRLDLAFIRLLDKKRVNFTAVGRLLASVDYRNILKRGFVLVLDAHDRPVKQAADIMQNSPLTLRFGDGDVRALAKPADDGANRDEAHKPATQPPHSKSSPLPARAFFEKVDAGFSQKNATKQETRAVDCVNQNKNRSSNPQGNLF